MRLGGLVSGVGAARLIELFTMRPARQGERMSRARSFWFEGRESLRALSFAQRLTGRYGLEYIRVEANTMSGRLLLYRWLKGEQ